MNKVIVSHPYSGSLQEFFTHELLGKDWGGNHSYYKTLWGKNADSIRTISLTLFSCYDEVIFSPVDNVLPDFESHMNSEEYYHPDFGLRMPARPSELGFDFDIFSYVNWLGLDLEIQRLLSKVPENVRGQILIQVLCDMELAIRHNAEVISSTGRKLLMERISAIDPQYHNVKALSVDYSNALNHYSNIILPDFEISSIDLLHKIKTDKSVREYGKSFVRTLSKCDEQLTEIDFALLIKQANLKSAKNSSINKYTGWAAQIISTVGIGIPLPPVVGAAAVALGETSRITSRSDSKWIELKPRMVAIKDEYDLDRLIEGKN
ncbi:hypothetical protein R7Q09_24035 [Vibrio sp. 2130-1]|nr:hypothetical protein [Vibrio sp. 2130-1]